MFWKKKPTPVTQAEVKTGEAAAEAEKPAARVEKLKGPREIPGPVMKKLTEQYKIDPALVVLLKAVMKKNSDSDRVADIRIFDASEAESIKVKVGNFTALDSHPELVLYEGRFDEGTKQVELTEKRKFVSDVPILTQEEILKQIEALQEKGSTVFFYQARGAAAGGPLGRGAAIIELNPNYPGRGQKKYIIYAADVVNMQPVGKGQKLFELDKAKEIASWVKQLHHKRMY